MHRVTLEGFCSWDSSRTHTECCGLMLIDQWKWIRLNIAGTSPIKTLSCLFVVIHIKVISPFGCPSSQSFDNITPSNMNVANVTTLNSCVIITSWRACDVEQSLSNLAVFGQWTPHLNVNSALSILRVLGASPATYFGLQSPDFSSLCNPVVPLLLCFGSSWKFTKTYKDEEIGGLRFEPHSF